MNEDYMMCKFCSAVSNFFYQLLLNYLEILDKLGNTILFGDPNETMSRRFARAAITGVGFYKFLGKTICSILNVFSPGHCPWALAPGTIGREIWHWSADDKQQSSPILVDTTTSEE